MGPRAKTGGESSLECAHRRTESEILKENNNQQYTIFDLYLSLVVLCVNILPILLGHQKKQIQRLLHTLIFQNIIIHVNSAFFCLFCKQCEAECCPLCQPSQHLRLQPRKLPLCIIIMFSTSRSKFVHWEVALAAAR